MPETIVEERQHPYSGTNQRRYIELVVKGPDNFNEAYAALLNEIPAVYPGTSLVLTDPKLDQQSDRIWFATADYQPLGPAYAAVVPPPEVGSATFTFNMRVEEETFLHSFGDPNVEADGRGLLLKVPSDAPSVANGLLGLEFTRSTRRARAQGITVPAGPVTHQMTYTYPSAVIPLNYQNLVLAMKGAVANGTWLGRPAGEMRLVGCSSSVTSNSTQSITFDWAMRENRAVKLGELDLGSVNGWDFYWAIEKPVLLTQGDYKIPFPKPLFAYVERLLPYVTMSDLGFSL